MQIDIKNDISQNDVLIFIKGEPTDSPCGYSSRAIQILNYYGVDYAYQNVLQGEDMRRDVKAFSGVKTLPQIFMKGEYFGGSDDIRKLHETGDLEALFQKKHIPMSIDSAQPELNLLAVTKADVKSCGQATAPRQLRA